jgi:branched-chain amino acid transport system permease protein
MTLVQGIANGVLLGLIYTAIAAGLSLTLGVMGLVNVAHSAIAILGAYIAWTLMRAIGMDPLVALVLVTAAFFFLGMLIERGLVRRVYDEPPAASLLSLFGLMIVLESSINLIWTTTERTLPITYPAALSVANVNLSFTRLVGGGLALVAVVGAHAFLRYSRTGRGIRAMAANRHAAQMLGINTNRLSMILFAIGTALAGTGGVAMGMVFPIAPHVHMHWLTLAILIVVAGGLGGIPRTMVAALAIALIETVTGLYLPFRYVMVVLYLLLILMLWVRTEGLLGGGARRL